MNRYFRLIIPALFFALGSIHPAAADQPVRLIVTGGIQSIYPAMNEEFEEPPAVTFERELRQLRASHPDAYLIDAGDHISLVNVIETHYGYTSSRLFRGMSFDAVALSARDAAISLSGSNGYNFPFDPENERERVVTNLRVAHFPQNPLPSAIRLEREGQPPVALVALADRRDTSATVGPLSVTTYLPEVELQAAVQSVREGAPLIAVASLTDAAIEAALGENLPDLVIRRGGTHETPTRVSDWWEVRRPVTGEVLVLDIPPGDAQPSAVYHRLLHERITSSLVADPTPEIGFPIPSVGRVVSTFLPQADSDRIQEDRLPVDASEFAHLTTRDVVCVYRLEERGVRIRLYRVLISIRDPRYPNLDFKAVGWPDVDAIVVVNEDHTLREVITRSQFGMQGQQTSLQEAFNRLSGREPEDWARDPELTNGLEEVWDWMIPNLRRVLEVDRRLFAEGLPQE